MNIKLNMVNKNLGGNNMKCIECVNCSKDEMKCYPKSKDCSIEYNLSEEDLYTDEKCDFAEFKFGEVL